MVNYQKILDDSYCELEKKQRKNDILFYIIMALGIFILLLIVFKG